MAIHCPECGFVNAEGANYCQKCGAYLSRPDGKDEPTTMTYTVDESGEMHQVDIDEVVERHGAALVIRSGGGRAGESFTLDDDRISVGRTPRINLAICSLVSGLPPGPPTKSIASKIVRGEISQASSLAPVAGWPVSSVVSGRAMAGGASFMTSGSGVAS